MFNVKEIENIIVNYASSWRIENSANQSPIVQKAEGLAKHLAQNSNDFFPDDYYTIEDFDAEVEFARIELNKNLSFVSYRIDDLYEVLSTITIDAEDEAKIFKAAKDIEDSVQNAKTKGYND